MYESNVTDIQVYPYSSTTKLKIVATSCNTALDSSMQAIKDNRYDIEYQKLWPTTK